MDYQGATLDDQPCESEFESGYAKCALVEGNLQVFPKSAPPLDS